MKKIILKLALTIGIAQLNAQPYYSIDITNQQREIKENFVKMGTDSAPNGDKLTYTSRYLVRNGKPWFPIMGEMHFSRTNEKDWENSILKMKACGIEIISTYVIWNLHEEEQGKYVWEGNRNLKQFLTLCKKHGMFVWLRVGPWSHAEIRYGGFPDWLVDLKLKLRTNDQTYLTHTENFFKQQFKQTKGFLFKEGGPVIAVQLENELEFKKPEDLEHMVTLKNMAIKAGFDVPYYSAFAPGPDTQDEFLYTTGGYPDSPWATNTKKFFKAMYFIRPLEKDSDIGSDIFGRRDSIIPNTYPKIGAEFGGGAQSTYHRRIVLSDKDISAAIYTRIAGGLNGLGYYMFHGGINPMGKKTSLEENRIHGYGNDVARIDYDFQAPMSSMGLASNAYNELKLIHLFIKDFGQALAVTKCFFPKKRVKTHNSIDTVQSSMRLKGDAGFIFLNNYQRHLNLPAVKNFQLHIEKNNAVVDNIPTQPMTFPENGYMILPYNMPLGSSVLKYATAQPLCVLQNAKENTYVFFAENASEFLIDKATGINPRQKSLMTKEGNIFRVNVTANERAIFDVENKDAIKTRIIVLSKAEALLANKLVAGNKEVLVIANASIYFENNKMMLEKIDTDAKVNFETYPNTDFASIPTEANYFKEELTKDMFYKHVIEAKNPVADAKITFNPAPTNLENSVLTAKLDSIISIYSKSKKFVANQPGSLHQKYLVDLPNQSKYNVGFEVKKNNLVKDWLVNINYQGDILALYNQENRLIYDQFNNQENCNFRLDYILNPTNYKLQAQVLPMNSEYNVYVEDAFAKARKEEWTKAAIKNITIKPIYRYSFAIKE